MSVIEFCDGFCAVKRCVVPLLEPVITDYCINSFLCSRDKCTQLWQRSVSWQCLKVGVPDRKCHRLPCGRIVVNYLHARDALSKYVQRHFIFQEWVVPR